MTRMVVMAVFLTALAAAPGHAADAYVLDPAHSIQYFRVQHLGLSFVRGRFDRSSGSISLDMAKKKGSADINVEVASISTGLPKLDEQLKSREFLDAAQFPHISFKSDKFGFRHGQLAVVGGELTLHGVTRPLLLKVTNFVCADHPAQKVPVCAANATATIRRSDYAIGSTMLAIGDKVDLDIQVEALLQKEAATESDASSAR